MFVFVISAIVLHSELVQHHHGLTVQTLAGGWFKYFSGKNPSNFTGNIMSETELDLNKQNPLLHR